MREKTKRLSRQEELFFALGISQEELELNRKGIISKQQGKRVWEAVNFRARFIFAIFCSILALLLSGLIVGFALFMIFSNISFPPESWLIILPLFASAIFLLWLCLIFPSTVISLYKAIRSDLKAKQLKQIEGLAIVDLGGHQRGASFSINGHYLRVNHATLLRIKHLEPHRVYYLPHSKAVVAVEVLENEDAIGENESLSYTSIHPKSKNK